MESITDKAKESAEKAKESVKESLLGHEEDPQDQQTPPQTRSEFMQHAIKDEETGEYYMGQKEFVNAVAPLDEDYVSTTIPFVMFAHAQHSTAKHSVWI